jgi:hypothetical protein
MRTWIVTIAAVGFASTMTPALSAGLHTWIEICPLSALPADCDLTTASQWYQLAQPQPNAFAPAIRAAEQRVKRSLPAGFYMKLDQFPTDQSMGTDSYVFFPCSSRTLDPATSADMAAIAKNGLCLR